jgi:prevent-host-death family protein
MAGDGASLRRWRLQDARARLSELVRHARESGPQRITVRGRDAFIVLSIEDYQRLQDQSTGASIIAAMRACPLPDVPLERDSFVAPVRDVTL